MSRIRIVPGCLVAGLAAGALGCASPETPSAADRDAALAALAQVEQDYVTFYDAGDASALASLWAEDGTMSMPLAPSLDRPGIERYYAETAASGAGFTLQVNREDAVVAGDRMASWGGFVVNGTGPDGQPFTAFGRYGNVLVRDATGAWKLFRHMYNWEVAPPGFGAPID